MHAPAAGAAAFAAEREYQKYEERNGKVENHQVCSSVRPHSLSMADVCAPQMAKDLLAGFAGAEAGASPRDCEIASADHRRCADKLFESHGLNFLDREKGERSSTYLSSDCADFVTVHSQTPGQECAHFQDFPQNTSLTCFIRHAERAEEAVHEESFNNYYN